MELMFQWFWLLKLALAGATLYVLYKWYKSKFKSKAWGTAFAVLILFTAVAPIKLDVDTRSAQVQQTREIEQLKRDLPPKQEDKSFEESTKKDLGIKKEDIDLNK